LPVQPVEWGYTHGAEGGHKRVWLAKSRLCNALVKLVVNRKAILDSTIAQVGKRNRKAEW
jgi:hypothetical protein